MKSEFAEFSDRDLLKFLQANNFNLQTTVASVVKHLDWRKNVEQYHTLSPIAMKLI